jgi:hypothetical protein
VRDSLARQQTTIPHFLGLAVTARLGVPVARNQSWRSESVVGLSVHLVRCAPRHWTRELEQCSEILMH